MNGSEILAYDQVDFSGIPSAYFLVGLLSAFENHFQAIADRTMVRISWKQFFAVICINMCRQPPTLQELAKLMGCSHQNTKQILLKLEKQGFVAILPDSSDRRKQRIRLTEACIQFCEENHAASSAVMEQLFAHTSPDALETTIRTISQLVKQLETMQEAAI